MGEAAFTKREGEEQKDAEDAEPAAGEIAGGSGPVDGEIDGALRDGHGDEAVVAIGQTGEDLAVEVGSPCGVAHEMEHKVAGVRHGGEEGAVFGIGLVSSGRYWRAFGPGERGLAGVLIGSPG